MKKVFLLIAVTLMIFISAEAAKKIEGYIHYNNNRKEKVTFLIPFISLNSEPAYVDLQQQIKYLVGKEKVILKADDVMEISFSINGQEIRMISVYDNFQTMLTASSMIFLKLEVDGPVRLYSYYSTTSSQGMVSANGNVSVGRIYTTAHLVVQRDNGKLVRPLPLSFREDMMEFFADCTELVDKIDKKILILSDLKIIVAEYNTKCL